MQLIALSLFLVLAVLAFLRMPGVFSPALVAEGSRLPGTPAPGDDDEQLPETDRAPRQWLPWAVAGVAALRVMLLVTLHA